MKNPKIELAIAVAASSAFPPVLSPLRLEVDANAYEPPSGLASEDLHCEPFMTDVVLTDGGVYDNFGLETAWKRYRTILVSDGGGTIQPEPERKGDWARHALRINELIDNQVRSLRKRQVIGSFVAGLHEGTYWGIRSHIADYQLADSLPCPAEKTIVLANTKTRLKRLELALQERLINWGYAICDTAMRNPSRPDFRIRAVASDSRSCDSREWDHADPGESGNDITVCDPKPMRQQHSRNRRPARRCWLMPPLAATRPSVPSARFARRVS